ncbi:MAG TPA: hypothetical protein PKK23_00670 [Nitrospirales bacterium]|nr:hypothetical protein [Nitrospiraceae bacterium]HNP27523.1 hypothetical protein [Nitrospirales bacterium]
MDRLASTQADRLILDAKKAILQEQHRRFQDLQIEGRWDDAWKQLHVTLTCAADLLKDSVNMLEQVVAKKKFPPSNSTDQLPGTNNSNNKKPPSAR